MTILQQDQPWPTVQAIDPTGAERAVPKCSVDLVSEAKQDFLKKAGREANRLLIPMSRRSEFFAATPPFWPIHAADPGRPDKFVGMVVCWCVGGAMELAFSPDL